MQQFEERQAITLENQGQKIFGIIHRPLSQVKAPAIIICPGLGGNKTGKFRLFVRLAQELVQLGFIVLRFDYRGCGDSEGEFQDVTIEGEVNDTLACLKFLEQDSQVDTQRIGLLGRSLGGAIAVLVAKYYKNIKSLVLWAPVFKSQPWKELWESFKCDPKHINQVDLIKHLPGFVPNLQFLNEFFNLHLDEDLKHLEHVPILHIQGEQDVIVKIEHAHAYRQARKGIERTHFVQLCNSDHDFSDICDQQIAIKETCQWFLETLKEGIK